MPLTAKRPSQELVDIVGALGGTWSGYIAMCRCPAHADRDPSLSIRQGDRGMLVTCFAGCPPDDVLRELRRIRPGRHYTPPHAARPLGTANVQRIWDQASDVRNTLAERYLARRNLLPPPPDIRFHPRCPYLPMPKTVFLPALLIAVRETRTLVAIQRIFLDRDSADYTRKVMLGTPLSGAWQGRGGGPTLAIAEGFETAEAFFRLNDVPCWASLGARRLDQLVIPASITTLLIAQDNDPEGRRAAERAEDHYGRLGLAIRHAPPPAKFKDWAKALDAYALSNRF
ncbi:virulence-associated protein E (plasmid) [Sphingomonas panacis]|uniref:Virulence-associated protein E n=1 Tax=Sphingomonas panacis TaxID=1560345 RepID=A0A1B3ZIA1_9SPHN|nr:toprim domain-containing protein [Sphingomonas panacis]AOH87150.1 virulence-associated protein E [Sphingomonas panacis]